uniref:Uncharacterized protein n=1 Tax=Vespula pensylvanica TaxID=30213 RepID=A0A834P261_VESPE|nr:hypothetical protein H0235_007772 [Vespula pensylvanica]
MIYQKGNDNRISKLWYIQQNEREEKNGQLVPAATNFGKHCSARKRPPISLCPPVTGPSRIPKGQGDPKEA